LIRQEIKMSEKMRSKMTAAYPVGRRNVILFLAANPQGGAPLKLGDECAEIERELRLAPFGDDFQFESRWAIGIDGFMRSLTELDPTVVHVSGHGGRGVGLMLQGAHGRPEPVPAHALAMMVETAARSTRVVVLDACYSAELADALRLKVDCVVGMEGAIGDDAARTFATRFYGALGNRRSIGNAVAQGTAALVAKQLSDQKQPRCVTRDGVDARRVLLHLPSKPARRRVA
jgi:hypothetical protein